MKLILPIISRKYNSWWAGNDEIVKITEKTVFFDEWGMSKKDFYNHAVDKLIEAVK